MIRLITLPKDSQGTNRRSTAAIPLSVTFSSAALISGSTGAAAFGQSIFAWPRYLTHPDGQSFTAAGDFDGDGALDLAIADRYLGIVIFRNQGDGTFAFHSDVGYSGGGTYRRPLATGDIDGDGDCDITWSTSGELALISFNLGQGLTWDNVEQTSIDNAEKKVLADVDKDGYLDIVTRHWEHVTLHLVEDGQIGPVQILVDHTPDNYKPRDIAVGDFDRDGDFDIAELAVDAYFSDFYPYEYKVSASSIDILMNDGNASFESGPSVTLPYDDNTFMGPRAIGAGDFDGDADLDFSLLVGNRSDEDPFLPSELRLVENLGGGTNFLVHDLQAFGHGDAEAMEIGDLDSDGLLDVVAVVEEDAAAFVFTNLGDLSLSEPAIALTGLWRADGLQVRDVTGDGQLELLVWDDPTLAMLDNVTPLTNPTLSLPPLVRGEVAEIVITGLHANERAWIGGTDQGWRPTLGIGAFGSLTFDLALPLILRQSVRADASGRAVLRVDVPANAPLGPVMMQAAVLRGPQGSDSVKTPFATTVITD